MAGVGIAAVDTPEAALRLAPWEDVGADPRGGSGGWPRREHPGRRPGAGLGLREVEDPPFQVLPAKLEDLRRSAFRGGAWPGLSSGLPPLKLIASRRWRTSARSRTEARPPRWSQSPDLGGCSGPLLAASAVLPQ